MRKIISLIGFITVLFLMLYPSKKGSAFFVNEGYPVQFQDSEQTEIPKSWIILLVRCFLILSGAGYLCFWFEKN